MAHMADGTEILTLEQARQFLRDNDCEELRRDLANVYGVASVEIDDGVAYYTEAHVRKVVRPSAMVDLVRALPVR